MSEEKKPVENPVVIPPVVLAMLNYIIKVGLAALAVWLATRYGIVLPIEKSNAKVEAAIVANTQAVKEAASWK
jgi:hypothetical protein